MPKVVTGLELHFWDVATGQAKPAVRVKGDNDHRAQVVFDPSGRVAAVGGLMTPVTVVEIATGKELAVLDGELQGVVGLALRTAARRWSWSARSAPCSAGTSKPARSKHRSAPGLATLPGLQDTPGHGNLRLPIDRLLYGVALDATGTLLATVAPGGSVELWDLTTGQPRGTWKPGMSVAALALSADGKTVAVALLNQNFWPEVQLWNVATGQKRLLLSGCVGVDLLVFSPDGQRLAVGTGADLQVCRVADGGAVPHAHWSGHYTGACFRADGRALFALGTGIYLWDLPP